MTSAIDLIESERARARERERDAWGSGAAGGLPEAEVWLLFAASSHAASPAPADHRTHASRPSHVREFKGTEDGALETERSMVDARLIRWRRWKEAVGDREGES